MNLTQAEKELYYWQMAGGTNFSALLYKLIAKADGINRNKLRVSYPEEVRCMERFQNEVGYWEYIEREMKNDC